MTLEKLSELDKNGRQKKGVAALLVNTLNLHSKLNGNVPLTPRQIESRVKQAEANNRKLILFGIEIFPVGFFFRYKKPVPNRRDS